MRPLGFAHVLSLLVLGSLEASAWAREAHVSRLFTASDLPRLAERGLELPRDGEYVLQVWAPERQRWSLEAGTDVWTLSSRVEGINPRPRWQVVGRSRLAANQPLRLVVAGARFDPPTIQGDYKTESQTIKSRPESTPIPALLALTTDPNPDLDSALDLIRGRLDVVEPPPDPRRNQVRTNHEGAGFEAPPTLGAWRDRANHLREQLLVTLGLWPMPPRTPLHPQVFGKVERDGYTIEKVTLETLPGFVLAGNLYRPLGVPGKKPGVLSPHGHYAVGRVEPDVQQRCIRLAKLGCVVFMYDMVGYNDSKPFGHAFLNDRLRRWGLSLASLQTWNSLRALDWLTTLPDVDATRIGCTGESGGGTQTFLLTAIDDRVRVAAPVVMVSDTFQGGCVCENAAGLRWDTDNVEFAALTAPRPLKLIAATGDWTARTLQREAPAIRKVYELWGAPERFQAEIFDFPHNYNQTSRNAAYPFLARWLLGMTDVQATREGSQTVEPAEDLRVFGPDHPAPDGLKSPAQLEQALVDLSSRQIDKLAPRSTAVTWEAGRGLLETALRVRVGIVRPAASAIAVREFRRSSRDGLNIVHLGVGRSGLGELIPVVRIAPEHPSGRATILFSPHGKAVLIATHRGEARAGTLNPLVKRLVDQGQTVIAFDPFLIGEAMDPSSPASRRPDTVHDDCYNRSLTTDRLQDLATVTAWAIADPELRDVHWIGQGRFGPLALLARPALTGIGRTVVDLDDFDYGDGSGSIPSELELPGVLQFGGLKSAAALVAPHPLWLIRPGPTFDPSWPTNAFALVDAAAQLRITRDAPEPSDLARWLESGESGEPSG
jgi:dienelactone hydrolase